MQARALGRDAHGLDAWPTAGSWSNEPGLVAPSARSQGGFRLYTESDVARLMVIRRMKPFHPGADA